nr:hypothetical protein [uncultured bacterium]
MPLPGFLGLLRGVFQLWAQQPLLWVLLLAVPNILAAVLAPVDAAGAGLAVWIWLVTLGIGTAPALNAMSDQWLHGTPLPQRRETLARRLLNGMGLGTVYLLVALGPFCTLLAARSQFPGQFILLGGLIATTPFHALLAPALALTVTEGLSPLEAVRTAFNMAGRRTWLHLGVMVTFGVLSGGLLFIYGWGFAVTLRAGGDPVWRLLQAAAVSAAESVWIALLAVCGLDALSATSLALGEDGYRD